MKAASDSHILVGMGGWQLEPFNGVFYPPSQPKGFRRLAFYSRCFDLIEVNATYHSNGFSPAQSRRWLDDVADNPRFLFTIKLYKGFTHSLDATERDALVVHRLLEPIAASGRLGGVIIQFPYSFTNTQQRRAHVSRLGATFRPHTLFVEFRHDSWNKPEVLDFLQTIRLQLVNVDLPKFKRLMPLTRVSRTDAAYVRLMGRNRTTWDEAENMSEYRTVSNRYMYRYSELELRGIADLITSIKPSPSRRFAVFHNDPHAHSLLNGYQLRKMVGPEDRLVAPETLRKTFPELRDITVPLVTGDGGLFPAMPPVGA